MSERAKASTNSREPQEKGKTRGRKRESTLWSLVSVAFGGHGSQSQALGAVNKSRRRRFGKARK